MFGVRRLFLAGLALVYLVAFLSWKGQVVGLIGANGILPLKTILTQWEAAGISRFWLFPHLFWINSSDFILTFSCSIGILTSLVLLTGFFPRICLFILWILYFSHVHAGQVFMGYQWDALLLEVGFLSLFLGHPTFTVPKPTVYLFRLLAFRLLFMSGVAKLVSNDPTWAKLTALQYHFETQPLPMPLAWSAHHLPATLLQAATGLTLAIELVVPFFFLLPRPFRVKAFWLSSILQILIILTGNYTYFNYLALLVGLFVIDDKHLGLFVPQFLLKRPLPDIPWKMPVGIEAQFIWRMLRKIMIPLGTGLLGFGGILVVLNLLSISLLPEPMNRFFLNNLQRYNLVNSYGLFAVMTTVRNELSIEGSLDGQTWKTYEFKYKPGDLKKNLPIIAPMQPRLDWQMWFAALSQWRHNLWLQHFTFRLLNGEPTVINLLASNPFEEKPPRWIRIRRFRYEFTDPEEREKTQQIWKRGDPLDYVAPLSL